MASMSYGLMIRDIYSDITQITTDLLSVEVLKMLIQYRFHYDHVVESDDVCLVAHVC